MASDPDEHHPPEDGARWIGRHSIRLKDYDYSSEGGYFVTMCVKNRECLFGEIVDGTMRLNDLGKIVDECWRAIPDHFPNVETDEFVVMPDHVHGIIIIVDGQNSVGAPQFVGAQHAVPLQNNIPQREQFGKPTHGTLPTIIRSFKSATTKKINETRNSPGESVWQRNYFERIIRNEDELNRIREYIYNNPARWQQDADYI